MKALFIILIALCAIATTARAVTIEELASKPADQIVRQYLLPNLYTTEGKRNAPEEYEYSFITQDTYRGDASTPFDTQRLLRYSRAVKQDSRIAVFTLKVKPATLDGKGIEVFYPDKVGAVYVDVLQDGHHLQQTKPRGASPDWHLISAGPETRIGETPYRMDDVQDGYSTYLWIGVHLDGNELVLMGEHGIYSKIELRAGIRNDVLVPLKVIAGVKTQRFDKYETRVNGKVRATLVTMTDPDLGLRTVSQIAWIQGPPNPEKAAQFASVWP